MKLLAFFLCLFVCLASGDGSPGSSNSYSDFLDEELYLQAVPQGDWNVSAPHEDSDIQQVHVSLAPTTESPGGVVVSFASTTLSNGAGVNWRLACNAEEDGGFANAITTSYVHNSPQNGGDYKSPFFYHVLLDIKQTDCTVEYTPTLGGEKNATGSMTRRIRIPPLASAFGGDPQQSFKLALVGDLGQTINSVQTMQHVAAEQDEIAALLIMGDLSYADNDDPRWDSWSRMFQDHLDHIPMFSLPGNHEIETDSADGVSFRPYAHRFQNMPNCKNGCGGFDNDGWKANMWFSFDIGSAHIIHVSSYHNWSVGSPQYTWLEGDLASVDRTKTPWLIVNLHAPWYNSNIAHQGEIYSYAVKETWQPLLCEHGVNIMFAGHVHSYERMFPTCDNSTISPQTGITYVNIGDGGNREGLYNNWLPGEEGRAGPVWSAFREGSYGHGMLTIENATHAIWEWHRNQDGVAVKRDTAIIRNYRYSAKDGEGKESRSEGDPARSFSGYLGVLTGALVVYSIAMTVLFLRNRKKKEATAYENITNDNV